MIIKEYVVTVLERGKFEKEKVFSETEYGVGLFGTTTCLSMPDDVKVNDVVILKHNTRNTTSGYASLPDTVSKVRIGVVTEILEIEVLTLVDLCTTNNIILKVICSGDELGVDLSKLKGIKTNLDVLG